MRITSICLAVIMALPALGAPMSPKEGEALYTTYCSACHAPDGKGATGGTFPPLAGSEWIAGNPKRSVAIVLKGLHGPVIVRGKGFNLEMPPQGAVLSDPQITAILNHVHSSWGNQGQPIPGDLVRTVRAEFESRAQPWTAAELLKLFPLEKKETPLKNIVSRVYKGQWDHIPDFSKIQAENFEEEHNGIIDIAISPLKDGFGIVWEGEFIAPAGGEYQFHLDADDGARVTIGGKPIVEINGLGPMNGSRAKIGKATLISGANPIRIEYYEYTGMEGLSIGWKTKGMKNWESLTPEAVTAKKEFPDILLTPEEGKTAIYRNFIGGTTPRAIGFGFPGELNLAYSADNLAPELVWSGPFMNAGRHWTGRGQGNQPPAGEQVVKLTTARYLPPEATFKGYTLDKQGNPTFLVSIKAVDLTDSWKPGETGTLIRTLSLSSKTGVVTPMDIPLGNAEITGAEKVTVIPGQPTTITYKLR